MSELNRAITEVQIVSKILKNKSLDIINKNNLDINMFKSFVEDTNGLPKHKISDIILFIEDHYNKYKTIPDKATLIKTFPYFDSVEVNEPDDYLAENLKKQYNDEKFVELLNTANKIHREKGLEAAKDFLEKNNNLKSNDYTKIGIDLISEADVRYKAYEEALTNPRKATVSLGLKELDDFIGGLNRTEELMVIQGRSGHSKTFILMKFLYECWKAGENVALFEPEMSANIIGYRLDSYIDDKHSLSNFSLIRGKQVNLNYKNFIEQLKTKPNKFIFISPKDFNDECTISKLRQFCIDNKITVFGVDGFDPGDIIDERSFYNKNISSWTQLTNISKDLLELSMDLHIPVISTAQAKNVDNDTDLGINTIGGSYGITRKCTLMVTMKKIGKNVTINVEKHRTGTDKATFNYIVDLDKGCWVYDGSESASNQNTQKQKDDRMNLVNKELSFGTNNEAIFDSNDTETLIERKRPNE